MGRNASIFLVVTAAAMGSCLNAPEDRKAQNCEDTGCPLSGSICNRGDCAPPDCSFDAPSCGYGGGWSCLDQDDTDDDTACDVKTESCECVWLCDFRDDCPPGAVCDEGECVETGAEVSIEESGLTPLGPFTAPPSPEPPPDPYDYYDQFSN